MIIDIDCLHIPRTSDCPGILLKKICGSDDQRTSNKLKPLGHYFGPPCRIIQVEKAIFSPFLMSTTGGIATEATTFLKRLAQFQKLSAKLNQSYPNIMGYLGGKLRFELLKTTLMAVRGPGFMKNKTVHKTDLDLNLMEYYFTY